MYISIRDRIVTEAFPTVLEGLRHLEVDAIEIELSRDYQVLAMDTSDKMTILNDADADAYRKQLDALNIRPISFLTACDFSAATPEENAQWMARAMELASLLGMDNIRIDSHMSRERELDFGTRVRIFADTLRRAFDKTAGLSVAMGIENHGFQGNNLAFLLCVFQQVDNTRLGSTLDTGNFYWRGYPLSEVYGILTVLAPYAKHTHLKNINYPEEMREQTREAGWEYAQYVCPLDEGDIDHKIVLEILKEAGYRGDVCIEDESVGKFPKGAARIEVLERDVAHVKGILRELGF